MLNRIPTDSWGREYWYPSLLTPAFPPLTPIEDDNNCEENCFVDCIGAMKVDWKGKDFSKTISNLWFGESIEEIILLELLVDDIKA